jgi:hypothetical protein
MASDPERALTRVDLPTPDGPMSTAVDPSGSSHRTSCAPWPSVTDTGMTGTAGMAAATWAATDSGSSARSALVRTTTGRAPLSQATATARSIRRRFGPRSKLSTITSRSTFAAMVCCCSAAPGRRRRIAVQRGMMSRTVPGSVVPSTTTQSPTAGARSGRTATRRSPAPSTTTAAPRSTRITRAGSPGRASLYRHSIFGFHP